MATPPSGQALVVKLPSTTKLVPAAACAVSEPKAMPSPARDDKPMRTQGEVMSNLQQ
jgi:hypothetical protein